MRFGEFRFRFRSLPFLLLALPVPLFVALALWQLDRAEQKRELAAILEQRSRLPAVDLGVAVADPVSLRYRKVRVRGRFEPRDQIYVENRHHAGRNGFHVITPLRLEGSELRVLVNRGWTPMGRSGGLPDIPAPAGTVTVNGEAEIPSPPALALHDGPQAAQTWGTRWPYLTLELFQAGVPYPLVPLVILEAPRDGGDLVRSWTREPPNEAMHLGYAVQWLAFAVIALVLYLRLSLSREPAERDGP